MNDSAYKIEKNYRDDPIFKIEKNVALPPSRKTQARKRASIYPFAEMSIGDSFFVPLTAKKTNSVTGATNYYNKKLAPKKFVCRSFKTGTRVWRVA